MRHKFVVLTIALSGAIAAPSVAAELACDGRNHTDEARYTWDLGGALSWLVGLALPSEGTGVLRTETRGGEVFSELKVRARKGKDYYVYESEMKADPLETRMSFHGYQWGRRSREERTTFDYENNLAVIQKDSSRSGEGRWEKKIPSGGLRDVLTGIHYLRKNASKIRKPLNSEIYSDGDLYPIQYRPIGTKQGRLDGRSVTLRGYEIAARPGDGDKWPGGVRIWLTLDARAVPVEISITQPLVSMDLVLESFESCPH